jgi:hypothetical protein
MKVVVSGKGMPVVVLDRLVYSVENQTLTVTDIAVGKRDWNAVYDVVTSQPHDPASP